MAEISVNLSRSESDLRETLNSQQNLLQKLYKELDVERESSATAASEALSMILRLQGEKAAVKMEAVQYKRLAEEKMCHTEESLANFEDLIYQKEMEIVSLEYQLQAYRYKLISMGCSDLGVSETKFPEYLLQRNESVTSVENGLRRNSMPSIPFKLCNQKKVPDDMSSYLEQIRKLDERLKVTTITTNGDDEIEKTLVLDVFEVPEKSENEKMKGEDRGMSVVKSCQDKEMNKIWKEMQEKLNSIELEIRNMKKEAAADGFNCSSFLTGLFSFRMN
ncbi:myosin-binding protein 7-like [Impatiens glandulifera]|uniref:myosin-binding protein 7-like n=1 Tax=Impatiens glandulifera TaxID=253017 RepID=UPI001FB128A1|nr:myosin-binding protein 7-like [Impatiens glandulifera]